MFYLRNGCMTKLEKLIKKFIEQSETINVRDIEKIALYNGYEKVRQTWSHSIYKKAQSPDIILPIHNNDCKPIYKKQAKSILYPNL